MWPLVTHDCERKRPVKTFTATACTLGTLAVVFTVSSLAGRGTLLLGAAPNTAESQSLRFYIGTYTGDKSQGIYVSALDLATGALAPMVLAGETNSPSFLAMHPSGDFLYAVSEVPTFDGRKSGAVTAWRIDRDSGQLTLLGQDPSGGPGPCHLVVDAAGKTVLVANYGGGSVSTRTIHHDGSLGDQISFHQHRGSSVNPQRQQQPHAHSINLDRPNRHALVADLGLDQILVYRFDPLSSTLVRNDAFPAFKVKAGAGPRHVSFHPSEDYVYVINELDSTLLACRYDDQTGRLDALQTVSTLPADFSGENFTAEVVVHPGGKFVYGSNRGHDSIAVFQIDAPSGRLQSVQFEPTRGKTPRNFVVDPTGQYLLAENQDSGTIVVFRIDPDSGRLTATDHALEVPHPVCIRFAPGIRSTE